MLVLPYNRNILCIIPFLWIKHLATNAVFYLYSIICTHIDEENERGTKKRKRSFYEMFTQKKEGTKTLSRIISVIACISNSNREEALKMGVNCTWHVIHYQIENYLFIVSSTQFFLYLSIYKNKLNAGPIHIPLLSYRNHRHHLHLHRPYDIFSIIIFFVYLDKDMAFNGVFFSSALVYDWIKTCAIIIAKRMTCQVTILSIHLALVHLGHLYTNIYSQTNTYELFVVVVVLIDRDFVCLLCIRYENAWIEAHLILLL